MSIATHGKHECRKEIPRITAKAAQRPDGFQIVTAVIAGPRALVHWEDHFAAVGHAWTTEDDAPVDDLVAPAHPSTRGYTHPGDPLVGRPRP